jgi:hypothetical protein
MSGIGVISFLTHCLIGILVCLGARAFAVEDVQVVETRGLIALGEKAHFWDYLAEVKGDNRVIALGCDSPTSMHYYYMEKNNRDRIEVIENRCPEGQFDYSWGCERQREIPSMGMGSIPRPGQYEKY